ncbi:MAG: 50S ribosomal protein L10 [Bacteroidota bacterium]
MNITEKEEQVSQIRTLIQSAHAIFVVDYAKVNVADINALRKEFLKEGIKYKVFKNTLFKKAVSEFDGYEKLNDLMVGMSGIAFVESDNASAPAKIIKKYFDATQKFSLKGCYIEKQFFPGSQLDMLSTLPTKPDIIAGIIGSLASPASGIVGAIGAVMRDIVGVLDAIEKKQAA